MTTIELLGGLQSYITLLTTLRDLETQENSGQQYRSTASLSYNTITLKLDAVSETIEGEGLSSLHLQCTFQIDRQNVTLSQVYCQNREREKDLEDLIRHHTSSAGCVWSPVAQTKAYNAEVTGYLAIADRIAKAGYLCSSGDDYHPGYFSKITVADNEIVLRQSNRWNAKSIDHKKDYHMRDLEFFIPLHHIEKKLSRHDYEIGQMRIHFSNLSSPNNKHCGEKIREQIEAEKLAFK